MCQPTVELGYVTLDFNWFAIPAIAQTPSSGNSSGFVLDLSKTCPLVASADTDLSVSSMS